MRHGIPGFLFSDTGSHLLQSHIMRGLSVVLVASLLVANSDASSAAAVAPTPRRSRSVVPFRRSTKRPVSEALLYANVAIFVLLAGKPGAFAALAKDDYLVRRGGYHRLVTACFLHGGVAHLLMNSQSLRMLGPQVEGWFGSGRFAALYLTAGVSGNALSFAAGRAPLSVGASGASTAAPLERPCPPCGGLGWPSGASPH